MAKQIEAEGGELVLRNKNGSVAIIPARHRAEVLGMLKDGCTNCLNDYISKLPKMSDYAEQGGIKKPKVQEKAINPIFPDMNDRILQLDVPKPTTKEKLDASIANNQIPILDKSDPKYDHKYKQVQNKKEELDNPKVAVDKKQLTLLENYKKKEEQEELTIQDKYYKQYNPKNEKEVKTIQQMLISNGYSLPKYGVDGKWGNETKQAYDKYISDKRQGKINDPELTSRLGKE